MREFDLQRVACVQQSTVNDLPLAHLPTCAAMYVGNTCNCEIGEVAKKIILLHDQQMGVAVRKTVTFEIDGRSTCDFCSDDMRYAGSNDGDNIVRACADHLKRAEEKLASERKE